jgi:hypothetical protein
VSAAARADRPARAGRRGSAARTACAIGLHANQSVKPRTIARRALQPHVAARARLVERRAAEPHAIERADADGARPLRDLPVDLKGPSIMLVKKL